MLKHNKKVTRKQAKFKIVLKRQRKSISIKGWFRLFLYTPIEVSLYERCVHTINAYVFIAAGIIGCQLMQIIIQQIKHKLFRYFPNIHCNSLLA